MMDYSDGDGKIERGRWMGQQEIICNNGNMGLMLAGNPYKILGTANSLSYLLSSPSTVAMTNRSDATMKRSGPTARYLPLPQPTSSPTDPVGRRRKNFSTMGHGYQLYQLGSHMYASHRLGEI